MNEEKGFLIKKVRCYESSVSDPLHIRTQRDLSVKEYKRQINVQLDENYMMAIYEGVVKGKVKRTAQMITMLDAAQYYKKSSSGVSSEGIVPEEMNGFKLKAFVKKGTQVLMLNSPDEKLEMLSTKELVKRLYYITIIFKNGRIVLRRYSTSAWWTRTTTASASSIRVWIRWKR